MSSEADVATAAWAIEISALVIAFGQLVAQLFSTADGYRRCQPSVIGDWFKLVNLSYRWSSFRFEVKVTTPHFVIGDPREQKEYFLRDPDKPLLGFPLSILKTYPLSMITGRSTSLYIARTPVALVGTKRSRMGTFCRPVSKPYSLNQSGVEDAVTWASLLENIHTMQLKVVDPWYFQRTEHIASLKNTSMLRQMPMICVTRKTRSWDLMPPDIVRPVASTTVGCLITMAHRMGMTWTDINLDEAKLRASGSGNSISASQVRGMGLVVEYSTNGDTHRSRHGMDINVRIPSRPADMLACGVLDHGSLKSYPIFGSGYLNLRKSNLPPIEQLAETFSRLYVNDVAVDALRESMSHQSQFHRLPGFADILGLSSNWMPLAVSQIQCVDNPFPISLQPMWKRPEPRDAWKMKLLQHGGSLSPVRKQVLEIFESWETLERGQAHEFHWPDGLTMYLGSEKDAAKYKLILDQTTTYFKSLGVREYQNLLRAHINVNAQSLRQAETSLRNSGSTSIPISSPDNEHIDDLVRERAIAYAENVPIVVSEAEKFDGRPKDEMSCYEDAWWMMMVRLLAWHAAVTVVTREGDKATSQYYDHPGRVYII